MYSTVQIRWIIEVWQVSSKALQLLVHGVASMSSIDLSQRYCLYALYNSKLYVTVLKKEKPDALFKRQK